jgi:hypothetical protein
VWILTSTGNVIKDEVERYFHGLLVSYVIEMDSSEKLKTTDNAEQSENDSVENVDVAEADSTQAYQIRPKLEEK